MKVKVDGQEGFVHRQYVSLTGDAQRVGGYVPFSSQIETLEFQPIPIRPEFTSTQKFEKHFAFSAQRRWQDHTFRRKANQPFQPFHGNQILEWQVLEFASKLDDTAAKKSISMGMPQILGLGHSSAGFSSVQQMFDVFSIDNQHQLIGFFTFIKNRPALRKAIKDADFLTFAKLYNGSGQAKHYRDLITARIAEFNEIQAI